MSSNQSIMDFSNIVLSYAVNATIHLGLAPDPSTGKIETDLNRAKDLIDILDSLNQKTTGNLTDSELKVMDETLSNLKMLYVKATTDGTESK